MNQMCVLSQFLKNGWRTQESVGAVVGLDVQNAPYEVEGRIMALVSMVKAFAETTAIQIDS